MLLGRHGGYVQAGASVAAQEKTKLPVFLHDLGLPVEGGVHLDLELPEAILQFAYVLLLSSSRLSLVVARPVKGLPRKSAQVSKASLGEGG